MCSIATCTGSESALSTATLGRLNQTALGSVTTRSCNWQKAAWIWLVKIPGERQPAIEVVPCGCNKLQHSLLASHPGEYDMTSAGFSKSAMAGAASSSFSQVYFIHRLHHFSFCIGAVSFGSQGWCHLSGFLLQEIWRHPPPSFAGHEGL